MRKVRGSRDGSRWWIWSLACWSFIWQNVGWDMGTKARNCDISCLGLWGWRRCWPLYCRMQLHLLFPQASTSPEVWGIIVLELAADWKRNYLLLKFNPVFSSIISYTHTCKHAHTHAYKPAYTMYFSGSYWGYVIYIYHGLHLQISKCLFFKNWDSLLYNHNTFLNFSKFSSGTCLKKKLI